jgi:hypothetical protein
MSIHIYHATATLAELSMAMSIAAMAKIVRQPAIIDNWTVLTLSQFIKNNVSNLISKIFYCLCKAENGARQLYSHIPLLMMATQLTVLMAMGYWPEENAHVLLGVAFICMMVMFSFVMSNRELRDQIDTGPLIEPIS